jgi:hypothetical protein
MLLLVGAALNTMKIPGKQIWGIDLKKPFAAKRVIFSF